MGPQDGVTVSKGFIRMGLISRVGAAATPNDTKVQAEPQYVYLTSGKQP